MKNIIFDMDGTIFDSEKMYYDILCRTAELYKVKLTQEQYKEYFSTDLLTKAKKIINEYSLNISPQDFIDQYRKLQVVVTEEYGKRILFDDTENTLKTLRDMGYNLYLCTNSYSKYVDKMLMMTKISELFSGKICREMCERFKPDPFPYKLLLEKYDLDIFESCAVEDSPNGIKSAKSAGLFTIGIVREFALDEKYTDVQVSKLSEIIEIVKNRL